jgi:serine protease
MNVRIGQLQSFWIGLCLVGCVLLLARQSTAADEQQVLSQTASEIIVRFHHPADENVQRAVFEFCHAEQIRPSHRSRFFVMKVPAVSCCTLLRRLRQHPAILFAEQNAYVQACTAPNDPLYNRQWHFSMLNLEQAWQFSTGEGVVVAVLDSGINPWGRDGFGNRLLNGYNALLQVPLRWEDHNGHGTHVAGTIGQETGNGCGVAGIASAAKILPVKVLGRFGYGTRAAVAEGILWAVDHGAQIINMSLGEPDPSEAIRDAVAYAAERQVMLIAAAGNDAQDGLSAPVRYPAAFEQVVAVSALDATGSLAWYSNTGPEIDIAAPGGDTSSDTDRDGNPDGILQETFRQGLGFSWGAFGWGYVYLQGTSMAAAHVTGVAALVQALHPDWKASDIFDALTATAREAGDLGRDSVYGFGILDAAAAVRY